MAAFHARSLACVRSALTAPLSARSAAVESLLVVDPTMRQSAARVVSALGAGPLPPTPPIACRCFSDGVVTRHDVRRAAELAASRTPLWLSNYTPTPPVQRLPDSQRPTAMMWLYRRGPELSRGVIHKLFRKRQVRVLDSTGAKARRVKPETTLHPGERVFVPRAAVLAYGSGSERVDGGGGDGGLRERAWTGGRSVTGANEATPFRGEAEADSPRASAIPPPRSRQPMQPVGFRPKDTVLLAERDLIVVNKPAGLPVTAGNGMNVVSVYTPPALGLRATQFLAPVHQLPTACSGVLILSKNEQMHALYAAKFGGKSTPANETSVPQLRPREIKQMFWALLDATAVDTTAMKRSFSIVMDYTTDKGKVATHTHCRVKAVVDGLMWVELRPQDVANAQLRPVCTRMLGCPIVGDRKHGPREPSAALVKTLSRFDKNDIRDSPLFLHARSTVVKYARGNPSLAVTAPLPKHMARVWDALGWDHAVVNYRRAERISSPE